MKISSVVEKVSSKREVKESAVQKEKRKGLLRTVSIFDWLGGEERLKGHPSLDKKGSVNERGR